MTPVRPTLNIFLSVCLAAQPLFAAGAPRPTASRFPAAHEAALEKAAASFVAAGQVDADELAAPLVPLATEPGDKAELAKFQALLKEAAALRDPVAAKPGAPSDGPVPEILDAKYKSRVLAVALKLRADGAKAAEARRELLRKNPPVGPDGKPAAPVPGAAQPPTEQDKAAIARMEARGGLKDARMKASAERTAAALGRFMEGGDLPAGAPATPANASRPDPAAAELIGVANAAFKGGPNTLATQAPKGPPAAAPQPPAEKGWWTRFRDATTIDSLQHKFEAHNKETMAVAGRYEDQSAAAFAKGNRLEGAGMAVAAWGTRLWAGDSKTVTQAAIGAAAVVATVVAAPILLPGAAAAAAVTAGGGATAGTIVAGKLVTAGLGALLTYNVTTGAGHFAHKPDLVNGALLAANAIAVPGLGKASEFIVSKTAHLATSGGRAAAETTGAVALGTAARVTATAAETGAVATGTAASGTVATGALVESVAAQTTVQVAVRAAPAVEQVAVRAVEGAVHNTLHVGAHSATAVDSH